MPILDIGGVLVSSDVITTYFCCDLDACKGACCIEGDGGAPVTQGEENQMKAAFPDIKDYLRPEAVATVQKEGFAYTDTDGDRLTTLFRGKECVFTCFEADGSARCAFEKGYSEGRSLRFHKPLSCYLYPVRVSQVGDAIALNYHRWKPICEPARLLGRKLDMRLYRFLKEPLTRAYGKEWYEELCLAAELYLQQYAHERK